MEQYQWYKLKTKEIDLERGLIKSSFWTTRHDLEDGWNPPIFAPYAVGDRGVSTFKGVPKTWEIVAAGGPERNG
jgi:hypothetical protein